MAKLVALAVLLAVMFGVAGMAANADQASATPHIPDAIKARIDLDCTQIVKPSENPKFEGVGVVHCTMTIDIPSAWSPPLPEEITLHVYAAYKDNDGNDRPSHGDRLLCIRVTGPGFEFERCRPGIDIPDGLSLPAGS